MKNYEKESLLKNFFVFFPLLEILLVLLFIELYHTHKTDYYRTLLQEMHLCSYSLTCKQFGFDLTPQADHALNKLYQNNDAYAYFTIPKSKKYYMKISYTQDQLNHDTGKIKKDLWIKFILATFLLFGVALFFTFYSLAPIRKALKLNDEFIKDILHDFNTPITAMVLNIKMFKDEIGDDPYLSRISKSIDTILHLQNNLKNFLRNSPSQSQNIDIALLLDKRIKYMQNLYPKLTFTFLDKREFIKFTNEDLLIRIFDNLLNNAAKYNQANGAVTVRMTKERVIIEDTGKGIKNIHKAFERYYKEQDRGVGLGLSIVQKLCNELNITITIKSRSDQGTIISLDFSHLKKDSF